MALGLNPYTKKSAIWSTLFGGGYANTGFETKGDESQIRGMLSSATMNGIEGIPYQFDSTVDRRLQGTEVGRKYAEKIYARMPLLILTPATPVFMGDSNNKADKSVLASMLLDSSLGESGAGDLIKSPGRYYTLEFAYVKYWEYVNIMLRAVAIYMGIGDISVPGLGLLRTANFSQESNDSFKRFFTGKESIVYYLDNMETMSRSFSNSTTESSLASQINGFADQANEIRFLFGAREGSLASALGSGVDELSDSIGTALGSLMTGLGSGVVGSLAGKGLNTIINGGKIVFPQIWQDSSADESYSLDIKLRSPDHDNLSIFLNIMKPYCKLLALTLAHEDDENEFAYNSPFMCKAYCKGMFSVDYGMITGLNVTSGAQCQWNDDGLPTQVDISIDLSNLYKSLAMSTNVERAVHNTAYMDFLANLSGLNINDMEVGRKIVMYYYLKSANVKNIPSRIFTQLDQGISRAIGNLYTRLS